ncbi:MAG TPA: hypothetical protein VH092_39120 [Urbifossiella sp.]|jgi:hypothetical protein|nr:hypothetical protein [Urbifossiella sp.]
MKASILRVQAGSYRLWVVTTGWATVRGTSGLSMAQVVGRFEGAHGRPDEGYVRLTTMCAEMLARHELELRLKYRRCRACGCTDDDCRQCVAATGHACHWVEGLDPPVCSRCHGEQQGITQRSPAAAKGGVA